MMGNGLIKKIVFTGFAFLFSAAVSPLLSESKGEKMSVRLVQDHAGAYSLRVNGSPFEIRGVAGSENLRQAGSAGANSFRTWGVQDLDQKIGEKPLLDYADEQGLYVTVGLWIEHERHGFCYTNAVQIQKQRDQILKSVRAYKNHPAVLMWGLGNEMEGLSYTADKAYIWKELNELAKKIKAEDPNHPVMTVIALPLEQKLEDIQQYYPALDILGINAYGGAVTIPEALRAVEWNLPVVLTEFGPLGQWEVSKTSWGAPVEPTSTAKAAFYLRAHDAVSQGTKGLFLGSYAFLWGSKHEATPTWYGMFLESGEKMASVDVMTKIWTGSEPIEHCPVISPIEWPAADCALAADSVQQARVAASDADQDALEFEWIVMAENAEHKAGGDREDIPPVIPGLILSAEQGAVTFQAPAEPGAYRLYVYVRDGKGGSATANKPFFVVAQQH